MTGFYSQITDKTIYGNIMYHYCVMWSHRLKFQVFLDGSVVEVSGCMDENVNINS